MVTSPTINRVVPENLRLDVLPLATRRAFLKCVTLPIFKTGGWYLAGGTALNLQVGHRQSVDLDFFTTKGDFKTLAVERFMKNQGDWETTLTESGTLYGKFLKAKVSFIAYPFFKPSKEVLFCGTVRILSPRDIAVMKVIAISQRGRKRDFFDMYWHCLNNEPLARVLERVFKQYPSREHNLGHFLKSLVYFADAEADPEPQILFKADWKTVKAYFRKEVLRITNKMIRVS